MDNTEIKDLCLRLMKSEKEEDVVHILREEGYWSDPDVWRDYGDNENNWSIIGSQQSFPDAALVEKLVNSIDARLTKECLLKGINPESGEAPKSIREAVAKFFENNPNSYTAGLITEWTDKKRTEVARGVTISATGAKPPENPCFTIADCGEGQTPSMMPETFLSLNKSNKLRIPFVQGKFNMGGSGVLRFCGSQKLQLILSRRDPQLINGKNKRLEDLHWGFTIVRRERPREKRRSSVCTYLAPVGAKTNPRKGGILHFSSDSMPIFPKVQDPYCVESESGTLIKLYEYDVKGFKTHMFRKGIFSRVNLLFSDVALPIRFHECRAFRGEDRSFETTLTGLKVRLEDDKANNLEDGFPLTCPMRVLGEKMTARIYAFKKDRAKSYRKNEGVLFTVNGQTQGDFSENFFKRKSVGHSYLADSLLVLVDCSELTPTAIEDLFMNSRDRLSGDRLRSEIEKEIEYMLRHNQVLRELRDLRRREQRDARIEDSKPLEDILTSMIKKSHSLSQLFLQGTRISNPFRPLNVQEKEKVFKGEKYPSYFKFKGKEYGSKLIRDSHINVRARINFETDAVNDYFERKIDAGEFQLYKVIEDEKEIYDTYTLNLQNGIATLNLKVTDNSNEGDELHFIAEVTDRTRVIEPFQNHMILNLKEEQQKVNSKKSERRKPPGDKDGVDRETPGGIQLPTITKVYEEPKEGYSSWENLTPPFDKYSALRIKNTGELNEEDESDSGLYDFFINVDNIFLQDEIKSTKKDDEILTACFVYGMTLLGISLIHDDRQRKNGKDKDINWERNEGVDFEKRVEGFSKAIAPVLLPMIENLGALEIEENAA